MFYNENRSACSRIVEELENIKINPIEKVKIGLFSLYLYFFHNFLNLIRQYFNFLNFRAATDQFDNIINENEIKNIFKSIQKINKSYEKINIDTVIKNVVCIETKKKII